MQEAFFDTSIYREFAGLDAHVRMPDESASGERSNESHKSFPRHDLAHLVEKDLLESLLG